MDKTKNGLVEMEDEKTKSGYFIGLKKNGDRYHGQIHISRISDKETICFVENITDRKRIEDELAAKQKELDRYFTASLDLLCIANTKGEFIR